MSCREGGRLLIMRALVTESCVVCSPLLNRESSLPFIDSFEIESFTLLLPVETSVTVNLVEGL